MIELEALIIKELGDAVGAKLRIDQDENGNHVIFFTRKKWHNECRFEFYEAALEYVRGEPLRMIAQNTWEKDQ